MAIKLVGTDCKVLISKKQEIICGIDDPKNCPKRHLYCVFNEDCMILE